MSVLEDIVERGVIAKLFSMALYTSISNLYFNSELKFINLTAIWDLLIYYCF